MPRQYQKFKRTEIRLPLEMYQRLSKLADETGYSIAVLIRELVTAETVNGLTEVLRAEAKKEANR